MRLLPQQHDLAEPSDHPDWRKGKPPRHGFSENPIGRKPCKPETYGTEKCHKSEFETEGILICLQGARRKLFCYRTLEARMTGLEPATSGVTGRCSNQL